MGYSKEASDFNDALHPRVNSEQMNSTYGINFFINNSQNVVINWENMNIEGDKDYWYDNTFYKSKRKVRGVYTFYLTCS